MESWICRILNYTMPGATVQLAGVYTLDGKKVRFHRQGEDRSQAIADGGFAMEELGVESSRSLLSQTWRRGRNSGESDRDEHFSQIRPRHRVIQSNEIIR
jgi:hypothetical protein